MASAQGWIRKNGRLESFLQRNLPDEWNQVTWYEPCIVTSAVDKPAYQFVVLTDEHLYTTDNPPRQLVTITLLADILNVELVNEYPSFLKGPERENTQHIKVTYKKCIRKRDRRKRRPASAMSDSSSMIGDRPRSVATALSYSPVLGLELRAATALSEAISIYSDPGVSEISDVQVKQQRTWKKYLPPMPWSRKKHMRSIQDLQTVHERAESNELFGSSSDIMVIRNGFVRSASCSPPLGVDGKRNGKSKHALSKIWPFNKHKAAKVETEDIHDISIDSLTPDSLSLSDRPSSPLSFLTVDGMTSPPENPRNLYYDSDKEIESPQELHLYILTIHSPIFRYFRCSWISHLIRATLRLAEGFQQSFKNVSREQYEQMLAQLQRQLQISTDANCIDAQRVVEKFKKELLVSNLARSLFWKDPNIFPCIVNKLRMLLSVPHNVDHQTIGRTMDKLKLTSSLVTTLSALLCENELFHNRSRHLVSKNAQRTKELLLLLVSTPWIPLPYHDVTLSVITSHSKFSSQEWEMFCEAPIIRSVTELTNSCVAALYQFVQLAYQGRELVTNQNTYGVQWFVKALEVKSLEMFISRIMCQMMMLACRSSCKQLTPSEAVLLHQQLSVLLTLVAYSPAVALHMKYSYAEEFKYYIFNDAVDENLPSEYPIRNILLQLVDSLRQHILQKKLPISSTSQHFAMNHLV